MKNILVVSVNWLGDAVFSTPVYRALKDNFPHARVTALAVPRVKEILAMCPYLDEVMVYDEDGVDRPLVEKVRMAWLLHERQFDIVFFLRPSFSRALLTCWAGIPVRVGFKTKNIFRILNREADDKGQDDLHRVDVYLSLLEQYGLTIRDRSCRLDLSQDQLALADRLLSSRGIHSGDPVCVLNTGGNWDLKQWPEERFAELARRITEEKKMKVVLPGSRRDVERVARVAALSGVSPLDLAGVTDLPGLAAIFYRAKCVISADSGPLHVAAAVGARTIALFGPTRPEITGPRGTGKTDVLTKDVGCNQAPCYSLRCLDNRCMKAVEVADVIRVL